MKTTSWLAAFVLASAGTANAENHSVAASMSTLITTPLAIEGLANDDQGNLYTPGRALNPGDPCPVWRIPLDNPSLTVVGLVPAPSPTASCSPSGLTLGPDGQLYVTQTDRIYRFMPSDSSPPTVTLFASGVPGTNGLAFDWNGKLWTGDGTTGQGRVWRISPDGTPTEVVRIQPMANEVTTPSGVANVGRDVRSLPPGTITVTATSRNASNTAGSQPLVANGLAFDHAHNLYVADTARGALWRIHVEQDSTPDIRTGCDETFAADTLCLSHVWFANPMLEGADGIFLDEAGNIWADANERNAVVFVSGNRHAIDVFRNPVDATTLLRNAGPLETPTSPVVAGHRFCTANSDSNRRDNSPSTAGEIGGPGEPKGKISCLDQRVAIPGMRLPVR